MIKSEIVYPAIVIGNCDEGYRGESGGCGSMPIEGFAIKTAAECVFIAGHESWRFRPKTREIISGTAWGVLEFLERFIGVLAW